MAATATTYNNATKHFALGDINWSTATIQLALLDNGYTFAGTDEFMSGINSHEIASGGYTRLTVGSKTNTLASNVYTLSSSTASFTWSSLTATNVTYVILFVNTGSDATSILLQCVNLGQSYSPTVENFTYQTPTTGFLTITAA